MILEELSILNYKNLEQADLSLSPNVNCLIGANGMGKTNVLDAVYFLSFGKSASTQTDSQCIRHEADFSMLQGRYRNHSGEEEIISCGIKRGQRKRMKRNDKEYKRLSEHLGLIPLVMISPSDSMLIAGGSEERRKFLDIVITQTSTRYTEALIRYNKTLQQRNALLKQENETDWCVCGVLEEMMAADAEIIYAERQNTIRDFLPIFKEMYARLCNRTDEKVDIIYESHGERGDLLSLLQKGREKEKILGYTLYGPHKDDLNLLMNGYSIRKEGSQGQTKTFFIAMKLSQFLYLKMQGKQKLPILLLDDIFDKLDAGRVGRIVDYVSGDTFGQIFITDTNREHLDRILAATTRSYKLFQVDKGKVSELMISSQT
ncbi:DNA replication and repair protein RecF [Alloprevotella sp. OH1205_COT-284]|uniref:DNA replication/repair protein RecF n=1 Tax=Alloprevotella sp. OH1205_COT-284 TaxID=2491043 RepID=UPI000F5E078C|nr:DNA replication and repair protein RecF [Alloprevotella sp. OH1205_COT-284]RRD79322.1 DNA replication and repair protein RecF [Alloprevotella sp. OH1205_COT-284]